MYLLFNSHVLQMKNVVLFEQLHDIKIYNEIIYIYIYNIIKKYTLLYITSDLRLSLSE